VLENEQEERVDITESESKETETFGASPFASHLFKRRANR
jgi:hypothetical protein